MMSNRMAVDLDPERVERGSIVVVEKHVHVKEKEGAAAMNSPPAPSCGPPTVKSPPSASATLSSPDQSRPAAGQL